MEQANKMRAKATKAVAAQNMAKRAERLLAGTEVQRVQDKVAALRFPKPAPCGKTPLRASGLSKNYGSLEVFTDGAVRDATATGDGPLRQFALPPQSKDFTDFAHG